MGRLFGRRRIHPTLIGPAGQGCPSDKSGGYAAACEASVTRRILPSDKSDGYT